jgi:hypothetical protein
MLSPMVKALKAGGEVDSWCTKCKLVLTHRIIAMVATTPVRVECSTCNSHHNFRARAPGDKTPAGRGSSTRASASASSSGSAGPRSTRGPTKAQQAILDRERTWEKSIAGKGVHEFRPYRTTEIFNEGDLIRHSKFGDGVVTRLLEGKKVEILFKDDARTLAHGLTD